MDKICHVILFNCNILPVMRYASEMCATKKEEQQLATT